MKVIKKYKVIIKKISPRKKVSRKKAFAKLLKDIFFILFLFFPIFSVCFAAENIIPPKNLYKGIILETSCNFKKADYEKELSTIICVIKNRLENNMSIGLCALWQKDFEEKYIKEVNYINKVSKKDYEKIVKNLIDYIFKNEIDFAGGALYYEHENFKYPYWAKNKTFIKNQYRLNLWN